MLFYRFLTLNRFGNICYLMMQTIIFMSAFIKRDYVKRFLIFIFVLCSIGIMSTCSVNPRLRLRFCTKVTTFEPQLCQNHVIFIMWAPFTVFLLGKACPWITSVLSKIEYLGAMNLFIILIVSNHTLRIWMNIVRT